MEDIAQQVILQTTIYPMAGRPVSCKPSSLTLFHGHTACRDSHVHQKMVKSCRQARYSGYIPPSTTCMGLLVVSSASANKLSSPAAVTDRYFFCFLALSSSYSAFFSPLLDEKYLCSDIAAFSTAEHMFVCIQQHCQTGPRGSA